MKNLLCFFLFFPLILLFSCSARIDGSLSADGSASVSINMSLGNSITGLIRTMAAAGGHADAPILDSAAINSSMSGAPGIASVSLRNTGPSALEGTVRISKIGDFLAQTSGHGFITFEQSGSGGRCTININRTNSAEIISLLSPEFDDYLNFLMAPLVTGDEITKTEYLELITAFFNRAISNEIASSRVRASIVFPGAITSVRGGTYSGRQAEFDIALIDLLVLESPVNLEVQWR
jgi:hypothetical protein